MKILTILIAALALASTRNTCAEITPAQAGVIESAIRTQAPAIRSRLLTVGRTSLPDVRPGVALDAAGHILCPYLAPIDARDIPYLVYLPDGVRLPAETIWENRSLNLAVIKLPDGLPAGHQPAALAPGDSLDECSWLLVPAYPPALLPGDPVQLHLGHLLSVSGDEEDFFTLHVIARTPGLPVFDLAGRLLGVTTEMLPARTAFHALPLTTLVERFPDLAKMIPPVRDSALPDLPYLLPEDRETEKENQKEEDAGEREVLPPDDPARDALAGLAARATADLPVVAIFNHPGVASTGIHGLIIDSGGLILSKASEIGPNPVCWHDDTAYPAVLLATDEATDLALLAIEAEGLPAVQWAAPPAGEGILVHSPLLHTVPPFDFSTATGLLSHRLAAHPAAALTIHSPEQTTSLGIVPEHHLTGLQVAALLADGPAAMAGVQRGDLLLTLEGKPIPDRRSLAALLATRKVGDRVSLTIDRQGAEQTLTLTLGAARLRQAASEPITRTGASTPADAPANLSISSLLTLPSLRRSGFPETLVHDLPLEHWQNGSPLCDSRGRVLGINIATVTLDRTLVLPAPAIREAVQRMRTTSETF